MKEVAKLFSGNTETSYILSISYTALSLWHWLPGMRENKIPHQTSSCNMCNTSQWWVPPSFIPVTFKTVQGSLSDSRFLYNYAQCFLLVNLFFILMVVWDMLTSISNKPTLCWTGHVPHGRNFILNSQCIMEKRGR